MEKYPGERLRFFDTLIFRFPRSQAPAWERILDAPGKRACEIPSVMLQPLERHITVPTQEHGNQWKNVKFIVH